MFRQLLSISFSFQMGLEKFSGGHLNCRCAAQQDVFLKQPLSSPQVLRGCIIYILNDQGLSCQHLGNFSGFTPMKLCALHLWWCGQVYWEPCRNWSGCFIRNFVNAVVHMSSSCSAVFLWPTTTKLWFFESVGGLQIWSWTSLTYWGFSNASVSIECLSLECQVCVCVCMSCIRLGGQYPLFFLEIDLEGKRGDGCWLCRVAAAN